MEPEQIVASNEAMTIDQQQPVFTVNITTTTTTTDVSDPMLNTTESDNSDNNNNTFPPVMQAANTSSFPLQPLPTTTMRVNQPQPPTSMQKHRELKVEDALQYLDQVLLLFFCPSIAIIYFCYCCWILLLFFLEIGEDGVQWQAAYLQWIPGDHEELQGVVVVVVAAYAFFVVIDATEFVV